MTLPHVTPTDLNERNVWELPLGFIVCKYLWWHCEHKYTGKTEQHFDALSITFDKSLITGKKEALKNSFLTKKSGASGWLMSQFGKSLITR